MANRSSEERLMRLETMMEQALSELKEMRTEMKVMGGDFASKAEVERELVELRAANTQTKKEFLDIIAKIENKQWVKHTLSGVLGAVLTALVGYFILNIGR